MDNLVVWGCCEPRLHGICCRLLLMFDVWWFCRCCLVWVDFCFVGLCCLVPSGFALWCLVVLVDWLVFVVGLSAAAGGVWFAVVGLLLFIGVLCCCVSFAGFGGFADVYFLFW